MVEYKVKDIEESTLEIELNMLEEEGWKLNQILRRYDGGVFYWYNILFEREVKNEN